MSIQKNDQKKSESYNFFPFTHGEKVEDARAKQKERARIELKKKLLNKTKFSRRENGSRSFFKDLTPMTSANTSKEAGVDLSKLHDAMSVESVNKRVPIKYMTAYPKFMKPSKHYPYRRLNDTHIENTMQSAVKRVEDDVKARENKANIDAQEFK